MGGAAVEVAIAQAGLATNPCCTLTRVGDGLTFTQGSWMIKSDYMDSCTSLVRDVMYVHTTALKEEGLLAELEDAYLLSKSDRHCSSTSGVEATCPGGALPASTGTSRRLGGLRRRGGRELKARAGAKGSTSGAVVTEQGLKEESVGMRLEEMAGMFMVH